MSRPRGRRRRIRGVVTRDKAAKTITVEVVRQFRHPKYGKIVRKKSRIHAHDEADVAHIGDTVEIVECRPMSRTKRWRLERVLARDVEEPGIVPVEEIAPAP